MKIFLSLKIAIYINLLCNSSGHAWEVTLLFGIILYQKLMRATYIMDHMLTPLLMSAGVVYFLSL